MSSNAIASDEIVEKAAALRLHLERALNEMASTATRIGLPAPPAAYEEAKNRMRENVYRVLVMGEAKRGKSTLINALMGDDYLPTDVNIATCQVFFVQQGENLGFRLRYEDDTAQTITREELERYGKESDKRPPDGAKTGSPLRWIEVQGPFAFIPQNIRLLDSPGLGSLYAEHAQITQRFVPQSDAVLFVLSSGSPIGEFELKAIEEILKYTRHIFFVQTQIDLYAEESWKAVLARNREVLNELFFGKIDTGKETISVWPISGLELLRATKAPRQSQRDNHLASSQFPEMWRSFRRFLFRATGCARVSAALEVGSQYHQSGKKFLTENIKALQEAGSDKRNEMQEKRKQELEAFMADWGTTGSKRRELEREVRDIIKVSRQQFLSALATGGRLDRYFSERIDTLVRVKDARELADSISTKIPQYAEKHWLRCTQLCRTSLINILLPALGETGVLDTEELCQEIPTLTRALKLDRDVVRVKDGPMNKLAQAWRGAGMFIGVGGLVALIPGVGIGAAVIGPAMAGGMLIKGLFEADKNLAEQALPSLRSHLSKVLTLVRNAYTETSVHGEISVIEGFFGDLEVGVLDRIRDVIEQRRQELQQRIKEMEEAAKSDVVALQAKIEQAQGSLTEWNAFAAQLTEHQKELTVLYTRPQPDTTKLPPLPRRADAEPEPEKAAPRPTPASAENKEEKERKFRVEVARIVRLPEKAQRDDAYRLAYKQAGLPQEDTKRIYQEEWRKKEEEKAKPAVPVEAGPEGEYRTLIRELLADGEMSEADYERIDTEAGRLGLSRTTRRAIEKEEGI